MAVVKPEAMKSYIWLQCADGSIQQVEEEVAMFCPVIRREILHKGTGSSKNYAICLPDKVNPAILSLILDYCRFHLTPGRSNKERKCFDEKFVKTDTNKLCGLASAAYNLQLTPLVDLTSRALARIIEGKTTEEIRETFHIPDDLTEEEKLEPFQNRTDEPQIRLLNRLYARKRKELKERQKLKDVEVEEEQVDERSVDDLLSFINGNEDSKAVKTTKNKKKNKKKKNQSKDASGSEMKKPSAKAVKTTTVSQSGNETAGNGSISSNQMSDREKNVEDCLALNFEFDEDDVDDDDELDPAIKEEIDREVEAFARRLNCDWPERMQEMVTLSQENRTIPSLFNRNRYTGDDR